MVSINKIQKGLAMFIDREVIPSLSVMEKVLVGTGAGLVVAKLPEVLKQYAKHPFLAALGVVDLEQGMVDIPALYNAAQPYIGADPIPFKIPLVDITLKMGKREIDALYRYIMEA